MHKKNHVSTFLCLIAMFILIIDSKLALKGASEGIDACIRSVIPSMLPFLFLSILLTSGLHPAANIPGARTIAKLLHLPKNAEHLYLIGLLGGYPVGSQCISQAYQNKQIHLKDAERMLAFCNNCGPAFIFGIVSHHFEQIWIVWVIWIIHVISSVMVALTVPGNPHSARTQMHSTLSPAGALRQSIQIMAVICGWIILFRVLISYIEGWFSHLLDPICYVALSGFLELANGCLMLSTINDLSVRIVLCSALLSLGGICVSLQATGILPKELNGSYYFPGKILHGAYSTILAYFACKLFLRTNISFIIPGICILISLSIAIYFQKSKNNSSILPQPAV